MLLCKNNPVMRSFNLALSFVLVFWGPLAALAASDTVLPKGTRITLQLNDYLSTKRNSEGDSFTAVVTMPVYMSDRIVIPKGSRVTGNISRILRPGRFKGKAVMNLLFQYLEIPGRRQMPIVATLVRVDPEGNGEIRSEGSLQGESSIGSDFGKVLVPSLAGAGIGTMAGGAQGAEIGAAIGAAAGLATVFTSRGKDLEVRRGSTMDISIDRPLTIGPEGEAAAVPIR